MINVMKELRSKKFPSDSYPMESNKQLDTSKWISLVILVCVLIT